MKMPALVAVSILLIVTPSRGVEMPAERRCKLFVDQAADLVRAGEIEQVRRDLPRLELCQKILNSALNREARKIIDDYETEKAYPKPADRSEKRP